MYVHQNKVTTVKLQSQVYLSAQHTQELILK